MPGLGFLEIIPRNIPIPGVQIIPASTCLGDTNPIHLEPQEFCCFRPIYSRTCGEGIDIPGFLWLHFQPFIHGDGTAHPRDFLGIPAHPSSSNRAAPSVPFPALGLGNGIFHKDVEQIKFPAGSEEMNLALNPGKQGEPAWRFIPGIPGLFLGSSQHYQLVASRHHKFPPEIISSRCSLLREERRAPANKNIVSVGNYSFRTTGKTEFLQFIHSAGAWSHRFFFSSGHCGFLFQIHFAALFLFLFLFSFLFSFSFLFLILILIFIFISFSFIYFSFLLLFYLIFYFHFYFFYFYFLI